MTNLAKQVDDLNQAALQIGYATSALYSAANGDQAVYAIIDALNAQRLLIVERSNKIETKISESDDSSWILDDLDFSQD